jgi:heme/copper-type cytochrome/quinol oxidase subunit 4
MGEIPKGEIIIFSSYLLISIIVMPYIVRLIQCKCHRIPLYFFIILCVATNIIAFLHCLYHIYNMKNENYKKYTLFAFVILAILSLIMLPISIWVLKNKNCPCIENKIKHYHCFMKYFMGPLMLLFGIYFLLWLIALNT